MKHENGNWNKNGWPEFVGASFWCSVISVRRETEGKAWLPVSVASARSILNDLVPVEPTYDIRVSICTYDGLPYVVWSRSPHLFVYHSPLNGKWNRLSWLVEWWKMLSTVPEPTAQTDQVFTDHTLFRFNQSLVVGCEKKNLQHK